ncbi:MULTISPECIES: MarR family winged helix-turn-helix transcriptional regulator [Rhodopirellula]|uniref:MarR family winged helix-turn-helix transcriptional regulator n=1 Tax=Rhodopirellula TaxID=265488 RepID=UPI00257BBA79|nr:MarR family transcriptional regulator [Rhodopirellula sp. UBA1907]MCR9211085.1 MarR family transcriptional regulator [bacterium]|tara:strand:+ start:3029 stop:3502 length:474 start_codon:yes stop_codon:yes gene_type:complete
MNLQQELNRPQPFRCLDQEVLLNFLRIGDQLDNRFSRLFREHGLTLSRFNILRSLALAERPLTCGEIGQQMIQVVPAVTSLVDHLCSQELVERNRCTEDRRVVHVAITEKGKQLVEDTMQPLRELEDRMLKQLSEADKQSLLQLLNRTRESISHCDD